ncbi:P-loop containing nucleoside triphosphate hydrolase protein [Pseudoneurospora amorphoporcata]|uniref:small monomeric GTPase n=1 Tax=Pseudoneurospora amorphoporcata TaxID=241081 RepID=A0AAN6P5X0_9PEZI|nr:P-loop containing nucleoside triphosphate hydrolase protein [Pseudoneurospora amorphoporcata]
MVNSLLAWTEDELQYLKAVLRWKDAPAEEYKRLSDGGANDALSGLESQSSTSAQEPKEEEIKILVLGAEGVGKTALVQKFAKTHRHPSTTKPNRYLLTLPSDPSSGSDKSTTYTLHTLELPHPWSTTTRTTHPHLWTRTLTEYDGALILYSVIDPSSLQHATSIASAIREHFASLPQFSEDLIPFNKPIGRGSKAHYLHLKKTTRNVVREFAMVMVGNKSDVDILGGAAIAATAAAAAGSLSGLGLGLSGIGERKVSTKEGMEAAKKLGLAESWFETSAGVTGENVDAVFEQVASESLRNRREYKEKKGELERSGSEALLKRDSEVAESTATKSKVGGLWKSLTTGWLPLFGKKKG